jgi:rhamnosyltransferase
MISVVIPVKNGGSDLVRCLEAIAAQQIDDDIDVVAVDSGSSDGSAETAHRLGARVHSIAPTEFHHGRTRNLGAELARGDILVFTSQDAHAADEHWLVNLTSPLVGEKVAGAYGRQLPHRDARPPERYFLDFLYGPQARTQRLAGADDLTFELTLFSNVNSAIPRRVWERFRFAEDIIMSEDQEWSRRVLRAGMTIRYEPSAAVHHSHTYTVADAFRRFFDSGASAERSYVDQGRESKSALWKAGARYARGEIAWLWRTGERRWIPYATLYELAKFVGLQLGRRHRHVPSALKRRLSDYPGHWST